MFRRSCAVPAVLLLLAVTVSVNFSVLSAESQDVGGQKDSNLKGHMEPFGSSGVHLQIEERSDFPAPPDFFRNYVQDLKPVKFSGAFRDTRAVRLWTDDYLLNLDVPLDTEVKLETMKKEDRQQETTAMHFHDFLQIYNHTEHYMVDDVPPYLRQDLNLPCCLQCPEILKDGFTFALMWFSSGGTKSVVHTDAFENINCVIRGQKSFVMLDPRRDRNKIDIVHHGAFSKVDVDSVDLQEYPGLAAAEFYHVNLTAGDCLYIPYRWIHQVRSFNSNVAVNFWWDHYLFPNLNDKQGESVCAGQCDPSLTLENVTIHGIDTALQETGAVKDWLTDAVVNNPISLEGMMEIFKMSFEEYFEYKGEEAHVEVDEHVNEIFELLDVNKDGMYTTEDNELIPDEAWDKVRDHARAIHQVIGEGPENLSEERKEYAEWVAKERDEL